MAEQPPLQLPPRPVVLRRLGRTSLIFALLLAFWFLGGAYLYRPLYRGVSTGLFNFLGTNIQIEAEPHEGGVLGRDTPRMDTVVLVRHRKYPGGAAEIPLSVFHHGYTSTALVVALALGATGGDWRFKRRVLLWSLILLHLYLGLRLGSAVLGALNATMVDGRPFLDIGPWRSLVIRRMKGFLWDQMVTASLIPPFLLWGFLALYRRPQEGSQPATS